MIAIRMAVREAIEKSDKKRIRMFTDSRSSLDRIKNLTTNLNAKSALKKEILNIRRNHTIRRKNPVGLVSQSLQRRRKRGSWPLCCNGVFPRSEANTPKLQHRQGPNEKNLQRRHQTRIVEESVHEKNWRQTPQPKSASEHQQTEERTPPRMRYWRKKDQRHWRGHTIRQCGTDSETAEHSSNAQEYVIRFRRNGICRTSSPTPKKL